MKQLKNILVKFFICGVLVLVIDRLLGMLMTKCVAKAKNGPTYEYNYMLFDAKPDIAIFGSSRARHHYNPVVIEQDFKGNTINYGFDGSGIFIYYVSLKTLLQHHTPKLVIIDVNHDEYENPMKTNRMNSFYPFFEKMNMDDSDLNKISPYEKYRLLFYTYRFNNRFYETLQSTKGSKEDLTNFNGYTPLAPVKDKPKLLTSSTYYFDKPSYECLRNIITLCKSKNIPIIVCTSPFYYNLTYNATSVETEKLCKEYNVPYLNYINNNYRTFDNTLFADVTHLDSVGANIFTHDFDTRIKPLVPASLIK